MNKQHSPAARIAADLYKKKYGISYMGIEEAPRRNPDSPAARISSEYLRRVHGEPQSSTTAGDDA